MDVNSTFLKCYIHRELYVDHPPSFKIKKALYDLKQVPRDWLDSLRNFRLEKKFLRRNGDINISQTEHTFLVHVFVDSLLLKNSCARTPLI